MKLKLTISIAAAVCVLAVSSARAQVTNLVTFSAVVFNQGPTNDVSGVSTFGPTKTATANTALLLQEIGGVVTGGGHLSPAAKLVLISNTNTPTFAVIDGANFYDLSSSGFDIMSLENPIDAKIKSGKQSDASVQKATTESISLAVIYDDTGSTNGHHLQFTLVGLATVTETRTAPVNNVYTDTVKGKIASMTGGGASSGNPFVATGSISFTGKAVLQAP